MNKPPTSGARRPPGPGDGLQRRPVRERTDSGLNFLFPSDDEIRKGDARMIGLLEAVAAMGVLAWYGSSLYVGARLLHRGVRDANPPARWIGTYLFFAMGLASILYSVAMARTVLADAPMTTIDRAMIALHFVAAVIANLALVTFTRRVFRSESRLASISAFVILAMLVIGSLGHGITTRLDGSFASAYGALYLAGPVLANAWAATESLLYWGRMRKRVAVGLAEPLEADRFLLWGAGAGSAAILLFANSVQMQVASVLGTALPLPVRATSLVLLAVLGVVCAGSYLLAFLPPRWYVARLAARSPREARAH